MLERKENKFMKQNEIFVKQKKNKNKTNIRIIQKQQQQQKKFQTIDRHLSSETNRIPEIRFFFVDKNK